MSGGTHQAQIVDVLAHEYAIVVQAIDNGPRGFVAETFIVDALDGRRYFVKLLPLDSHLAELTDNLGVLDELHALSIDNVSRPIRSEQGKLATKLQGRTLIVFDFFAGQTGDSAGYDFAQYVDVLARIHQITPQVKFKTRRETFGLPFVDEWQHRFAYVLQTAPTSAVQTDLQQLMQQHREQISNDWLELLSLSQQCRQESWTPLITHSDAHGGNLIVGDNGKLYLIDWDELMLGPAERDTWFHLNDDETAQDFLRVYRRRFPDYAPNPLFQRFYVFRRFFEDLLGYLIEITTSPSLEHQRKNLNDLNQTCFEWLWPLMRRDS